MVITEAAVHTTGINWQSVAVISGAVITAISTVFAFVARYVGNKVTGAINELRIEVIEKLDKRLTTAEAMLSNIQSNTRRR